jgi:uncharacterized membrane protein
LNFLPALLDQPYRQQHRGAKAVEEIFNVVLGAVAAITIVVGLLVALALAAIHFGVDSRPSINDRDQRPWL